MDSEQVYSEANQSFRSLYDSTCDRIRAEGCLDDVIKEFQKLPDDLERVKYAFNVREFQGLQLGEHFMLKSAAKATQLELLYDTLVTDETAAPKALEVIRKSLSLTLADDVVRLAVRYMKRGWAFMLMEQFEPACADARRCLALAAAPGHLIWNAYEILGYGFAKEKDYKKAESYFTKALDFLRQSADPNEVKAMATGRIMSVFRTIKGSKEKKTRKEKEGKSDTEFKERVIPNVSYGGQKVFENASAALDVIVTSDRGRAVISNRDIKPGDILIVEPPYAAILNPNNYQSHCYNCYRPCVTLEPCHSCSKVGFCSDSCRSISWKNVHGIECRILGHLEDRALGKLGILVFRVLVKATWPLLKKLQPQLESVMRSEKTTDEGNDEFSVTSTGSHKWRPPWHGKYSGKEYLSVFHMVTNACSRSFGDLFKRALSSVFIAVCLLRSGFFGSEEITHEMFTYVAALALRHLQNASCNAYEISECQVGECHGEDELTELGGAVYPTVSLTNHSCTANASRYSVGLHCVLRATRSIPRGTEIFDNYGFPFHMAPIQERREVLRSQYKFECSCQACREAWPLYPHGAISIHGSDDQLVNLFQFRCPNSVCGHRCDFVATRQVECPSCGNKSQFVKLVAEIQRRMEVYGRILEHLRAGKYHEALPTLWEHQTFLDRHALWPAKHCTDVQEAIKHYYNRSGNKCLSGSMKQL